MRRLLLAAVVAIAAIGALTVAAEASYFNPKGLYDRQVFQSGLGYFTHVDYYKFGPNNTYDVSFDQVGSHADPSGHARPLPPQRQQDRSALRDPQGPTRVPAH